MFTVVTTKTARRSLMRMPRNLERRIVEKIKALAGDPFAPNPNLTPLKGIRNGYRLRVGDWRILYTLDTEASTIVVAAIEGRGGVYR